MHLWEASRYACLDNATVPKPSLVGDTKDLSGYQGELTVRSRLCPAGRTRYSSYAIRQSCFPCEVAFPVSHVTPRRQQRPVNLLCPHFHHQDLVASVNNLPRICGTNRPRANDNDLGKDGLAEE